MFVRSSKDSRKGSATQKTAVVTILASALTAVLRLFDVELPKDFPLVPILVGLLAVGQYFQRRATNGGQ